MINTITLNPALDRILFIDRFEPGATVRVRESGNSLGGKGAHISVNLSMMGIRNRAFAAAFGATGKKIEDTLKGFGAETCFVWRREGLGFENRTNYVVIENDKPATIIAERGVDLEAGEVDALLESLLANSGDGDCFVFSGDASNVSDPYVYNRFIEAIRHKTPKVFLDASGPTLAKALEAQPFLVKPNRDEIESITGIRVDGEADALRAIQALAPYNIECVALTLGAEGAVVKFGSKTVLQALPPAVDVKNTSGCGDAFLACLVAGFDLGWGEEEMLRRATAVAAATAASPLTVGFDANLAAVLTEQVEIRKL